MTYDVIIIGGGITGAGIARDCALRGLNALLLEKGGLGQATTGASTHLIHGGLRYLLYDRLTTHTTAWDAGNIVRIARPLLTRLPILWPIYRDHQHGPEVVETLLEAYDPFQKMKGGRPHLRLNAHETSQLIPALTEDGLIGAVSFDEWWVDAVKLVEKNIDSARAYGAEIRTGIQVTGIIRSDGQKAAGVTALDKNGETLEFQGKVIVNAAGPWVDSVSRMAGISTPMRLRKGTHLVYDRPLTQTGLLLEAADRARYVFVIPFKDGTLVGPTDLPLEGSADGIQAAKEEIQYLLDTVHRYLPDFPEDFKTTRTGARPILGQSGAEKLLSREYEIIDHANAGMEGFLSAAGGKMSDFRLMAKDTVDLVCRKLGSNKECRSHTLTLDNSPVTDIPHYPRPWPPLKRFLRGAPRLRELYALAHLGICLMIHIGRRLTIGVHETSSQQFRKHYGAAK